MSSDADEFEELTERVAEATLSYLDLGFEPIVVECESEREAEQAYGILARAAAAMTSRAFSRSLRERLPDLPECFVFDPSALLRDVTFLVVDPAW